MDHISCMTSHAVNIDRNDLRPALARITNAIEWNLERTPEGRTLFMGFGEDHYNPTHPILEQMTIQWMQSQGIPMALGYETPLNTHSLILANPRYGFDAAKHLRPHLEKTDPLGARQLISSFSWEAEKGDETPRASDNLLAYCLTHNVNTRFNDAARMKFRIPKGVKYGLDPEDPETVAAFGPIDPDAQISTTEALGVHIRNTVMVARSIRHAEQAKAHVYMFHTGTFHLGGGNCHGTTIPHEHGMLAQFKDAGQQAMAIFPTREHYNVSHLPAAGRLAVARNAIIPIDELPQYDFDPTLGAELETAFIERIHKASGNPVELYDLNTVHQLCAGIVRAEGLNWIEQARMSALAPL